MTQFYEIFIKVIFLFLILLFILSSLDELFFLLNFVVFKVYKFFKFDKQHKVLNVSDLTHEDQKPIAVMVACWDESNVIRETLRRAVGSIKYNNYKVFVGVYPNDKETIAEVKKAAEESNKIEVVMIDHDGPTTKSDNVNTIWRHIMNYEKTHKMQFEIFVIHDAEDNVPVYELSIFNHLIPRKDVVQLPVLPIKTPWYSIVSGTYMDEFASMHLMQLRVREWMSGLIPTAGVGCGFSREFMVTASKKNAEAGPLAYNTLTEDYELPLLNQKKADKEAFYDSIVEKVSYDQTKVTKYLPAVRSYFPKTLRRAIIQKSRWILGISLQGADHIGWKGDLATKYMLFRDRKGVVTNIVTLMSLILIIILALDLTVRGNVEYLDIFSQHPSLRFLITLNVISMIVLIFTRIAATTYYYGIFHGLMSFPRIFVGNIVNGLATLRAIRIYYLSRKTGESPKWEKTQHEV